MPTTSPAVSDIMARCLAKFGQVCGCIFHKAGALQRAPILPGSIFPASRCYSFLELFRRIPAQLLQHRPVCIPVNIQKRKQRKRIHMLQSPVQLALHGSGQRGAFFFVPGEKGVPHEGKLDGATIRIQSEICCTTAPLQLWISESIVFVNLSERIDL